MPDLPWGVNLRGLARTAAVGLMKASWRSLVSDAGSGLPFHFSSSGLGSNRSSWLGPPSMNMKMTFFAFGANMGGFGARGLVSAVAPYPSPPNRFASAIVPTPPAQLRKNFRRDWILRYCSKSIELFPTPMRVNSWRGLRAASRLVSTTGEERRDESRRRRPECPRHVSLAVLLPVHIVILG